MSDLNSKNTVGGGVTALKILVVDDHALFRQGLAMLLRDMYANAELIEASSSAEALAAAERRRDIRLVLLDLKYPEGTGFETLEKLVALLPGAAVVVVSASENIRDITASYRAGAKGYIVKSSTSDILRHALPLILAGETYIPSTAMAALTGAAMVQVAEERNKSRDGGMPMLTPRQHEILTLMAQGLQNKDIATRLGMLEGTVKVHVKSVLQKLGVNNRTHAVVTGMRLGLIASTTVLPDDDI